MQLLCYSAHLMENIPKIVIELHKEKSVIICMEDGLLFIQKVVNMISKCHTSTIT